MLQEVVRSGVFEADPFVLIDVGCGLGIDDAWRLFEPYLRVHAFDPQTEEIRRLAATEGNEHVHYHAGFVGLPQGHPFHVQQAKESASAAYFDLWLRTSTAQALERYATKGATDLEETNDWRLRDLDRHRIELPSFLEEQGVLSVDFVKTDTDGDDLEVLLSLEPAIDRAQVLGLMVETTFTSSAAEGTHTFHNMDRLLRRHGYQLATLSVNRYSRAALPAPFVYSILAQTTWGQAMWGDAIYIRDGVQAQDDPFGDLGPTKLVKLACIAELFRMPDIAAEILVKRSAIVGRLVDIDKLLDLLTPPLGGQRVRYRDYIAAFESDPTLFYPGRGDDPPPAPEASEASSAPRVHRRLLPWSSRR